MKLIVGLGNPGREYLFTRHNAGFMVVDAVCEKNNIHAKHSLRFKADICKGSIGKHACVLAKPNTFMNLSGSSVASMQRWFRIKPVDILLILDDIALPFGSIRIKPNGSDGGHKGLKSVAENLGTDDFARLRIGIKGRDDIKDLSSYVLGRFTKKEQAVIPELLNMGSSACECWIKEGIDAAMNKYN